MNKFKLILSIFIGNFLLVTYLEAYAANSDELDISKIPLSQCTFEKADSALYSMSLSRTSTIAKNTIATVNEIRSIVDHAEKTHKTNQNTRIADILSLEELEKVNEANQRLAALQMEGLIEGDFDRDVATIYRLVELAGDYYRGGKIPPESDKDNYLLMGFLLAGDQTLSFDDLSPVEPINMQKCNLDYSLFNLEIRSLNKLGELNKGWDMATAKIEEIYKKYHAKDMDFSILNQADKNDVSYLENKHFLPQQRELKLFRYIELIRHYARVSALRYESSMSDLLYSGGDISKTSVTMNKKIKNGELSKTDIWVYKIWNVIDEKMPSEAFKSLNQMNIAKKRTIERS